MNDRFVWQDGDFEIKPPAKAKVKKPLRETLLHVMSGTANVTFDDLIDSLSKSDDDVERGKTL